MRSLLGAAMLVLSAVACAGPHSTGALWAQQNLDQERAMYQLSDAQRAGIAQAFELSLADESLQAERARITAGLQNCPLPLEALAISPGDRVRDGIRMQSQADPTRRTEVAQLALADWYTRRANATGDTRYCERARSSLVTPASSEDASADLLANVPAATVSRDQSDPVPPLGTDQPLVLLSAYALGAVDSVSAPAPLPQYLAAVYGGFISSQPVLDEESAANVVDRQAPAYPDWEPDALYAALRGAQS
jgi:hypothetical protein